MRSDGEPVDLGEGARHHRVLGGRHQLDPGLVVVGAHIFGVGRVEHQQHVLRQPRAQTLHLVEAEIVPVGLFGLARNTIRVFGVTQARIASTSAV